MEQTKEIVLKVKFTAKHLFLLIAIALFAWRPGVLNSAQSMTMTSYYPAPYGGYNKLLTTGNTYLGDTSGSVVSLARKSGMVCMGSMNSGATNCANSSTGQNATIYQIGESHFGYPKSGSTSSGQSASGSTYTYGSTNLSYLGGYVSIGYSKDEPTYSSYPYGYSSYGVHSNVPLSTNKWIYVGPNGKSSTYNSPRQLRSNSSSVTDARAGILVDSSATQAASGVVVIRSLKTAFMNVLTDYAIIGGGLNTPLQIMASEQPLITLDDSASQKITLEKDTRIKGNLYLGNVDNSSGQKGNTTTQSYPFKQNSTRIYNLCYYQPYGYTSGIAKCQNSYMPVGFLPNNLHSNTGTDNDPVIGVFNFTSGKDKHRTYNSSTHSTFFSQDVRATAAGYMVCCAMYIPIQTLPDCQQGSTGSAC